MTRTCDFCGNSLPDKYPNKRYCNKKCKSQKMMETRRSRLDQLPSPNVFPPEMTYFERMVAICQR